MVLLHEHYAIMTGKKSVQKKGDFVSKLVLSEESSEPYYRQLKRNIERLIANGDLEGGLNLPSERDLAAALKLSRTTIKRCYDDLRQAGVLTAHGRSGTQINKPPMVSPPLGRLKGFTEEMQEQGRTPSTRVVSHEIVNDRTIASVFNRPSNASFLRLVRVRLADDAPMTREVAWYDLTLAPALAEWDTSGSAYAFLKEHCGITLSWAEQSIEAVISSEVESQTFGFEENSPCLLLKRRSHTADDVLVEYVEGTFRGDAYAYRVKLELPKG